MTIIAIALILVAGFLTIGVGVNVGSLHSSDAAGNGLAEGFAVVLAIGDWIILTILLLLCGARDGFPGFSGFAIAFAFPLAIAGHVIALRLLTASKTEGAAAILLPVVTVAGPALLIVRAAWGLFPPLRASVPEPAGSWAPIVLLALISLVPFPFLPPYLARKAAAQAGAVAANQQYQQKQTAQNQQHIQETRALIEALPSDGPLFSALVYCADPEAIIRDAARAKARTFTKRQADAEELLASGHDATLREIPNFNLTPSPALCESARKALANKSQIKPFDNDPIRIEDAEREVAPYIETMRWLLANGCDCKSEVSGLEKAVGRFANSRRREKLLADLIAAGTNQ